MIDLMSVTSNPEPDENDCYDCEEILKELERIDDEADDLEIMFVKIRDTRYAKKFGITSIPTLVFFRLVIVEMMYDLMVN